jgi:hypothetical protein
MQLCNCPFPLSFKCQSVKTSNLEALVEVTGDIHAASFGNPAYNVL